MRTILLLVSSLTLWLTLPPPQEPQPASPQSPAARPPAPPAQREPLAPVEVPYVERVPRGDLPERFGVKDAIEGFWELRERNQGGVAVDRGNGYMAIGRRHMLVQFQAPGLDPEIALLRATTYAWTRLADGNMVRTTVLLGHYNDADGDVHVEAPGTIELRRFELMDRFLRVYQENGDWLLFARVE